MPIVTSQDADALPTSPPWTAEQTAQDAAVQRYHAAQNDAAILSGLFLGGAVLALMAYGLRHRARRALVAIWRLIDRAAYAVGIDSRRIAARWGAYDR